MFMLQEGMDAAKGRGSYRWTCRFRSLFYISFVVPNKQYLLIKQNHNLLTKVPGKVARHNWPTTEPVWRGTPGSRAFIYISLGVPNKSSLGKTKS